MKVNVYSVLERAIEEGTAYGIRRAHKHVEDPSEEELTDAIVNGIMNSICEVFTFNDDLEEPFGRTSHEKWDYMESQQKVLDDHSSSGDTCSICGGVDKDPLWHMVYCPRGQSLAHMRETMKCNNDVF